MHAVGAGDLCWRAGPSWLASAHRLRLRNGHATSGRRALLIVAFAAQEGSMIQQNIKAATNGPRLFIGQDRCGRWVVRDARSMCGGVLSNRTAAIRFATYECQRRPQSVIMLPDGLELDAAFTLPNTADYISERAA